MDRSGYTHGPHIGVAVAASALIWLIRFLHIGFGVAWVGGAAFWTLIVAPRLLQNGPPPIRRPVMEAVIDIIPRYYAVVGGNTILWGIVLLGTLWGWNNFIASFQMANYGFAIGIGLLLALVMLYLGFGIIKPTSKKMLALMQNAPPGPPSAEMQAQLGAMGKRMGMASFGVLGLGIVTVGLMTWAVNTHLCSGC